ncbi:GATOR complex protein NPRL2 [Anopheles ziemanni]|uniref:GATOR complex protein NPRL2 n=1 Tax=Anopheles coustani TaxID=139045 RepID=UPI002658C9A6|nr:GATOR complex protein NPRL2 [Anopheles coustani]XP_058175965.1 GATOR complex protein NPRL2 [Anopheles ziemanni]
MDSDKIARETKSNGMKDGPIRCILLSEFHAVAGSKISYQVPENFISKEVFDSIRTFIIPKPQLQRCTLTINTLGYKVIGYPVLINHVRYQRNAFYFNLCFVCYSWSRTVQYEAVVKKMSEYLLMMEEETSFLSNPEKNGTICNLLSCILRDLNERQVATIVEGDTTIYLKIGRHKPDPPMVQDHQVPLLCRGFEDTDLDAWDLTTQQVLPFINGINHVARIAVEADVENQLVKSCIQNLVYYGVVQMLPLLKYSNVYMCTRALQKLTRNRNFADECRKYVQLQHADKVDTTRPPSLFNILQLYSQMTHGVTLRSLCQRLCPRDNNIDERKLVSFGLQHNLIRCINKYPIFTGSIPTPKHKLYTGLNSFDEICCKTGLSPSRIEQEIDMDSNVTVIWK